MRSPIVAVALLSIGTVSFAQSPIFSDQLINAHCSQVSEEAGHIQEQRKKGRTLDQSLQIAEAESRAEKSRYEKAKASAKSTEDQDIFASTIETLDELAKDRAKLIREVYSIRNNFTSQKVAKLIFDNCEAKPASYGLAGR